MRRLGQPASRLAAELGFADSLEQLVTRTDAGAAEKTIVEEIRRLMLSTL
jgi:hypothetical protein